MAQAWSTNKANIVEVEGWTEPLLNKKIAKVPPKFASVYEKLVVPGLVASHENNVYIFSTTTNVWSPLSDPQSMVFVNSAAGNDGVSVNYTSAVEPYVPFLERAATMRVVQEIPETICIGTVRLQVRMRGMNGLTLERCFPVVHCEENVRDESGIMQGFCAKPVAIRWYPTEWEVSDTYPTFRYLRPFFPNYTEMESLMWCLGHALIDPGSSSKAVVLTGEGGQGKSTIINVVNTTFGGCCKPIPDHALEKEGSGISQVVTSLVVCNRIVTASDVGGAKSETNLGAIKHLTGNDQMVVGTTPFKTRCTLLYATNYLDDPLENKEWCTPALMRRFVIILIAPGYLEHVSSTIPTDEASRLDFVLRCVHTRMVNTFMPVSALSVVMTITGSRFKSVAPYLVEGDDATEEDMAYGTLIVGVVVAKNPEEVGLLASLISKRAVEYVDGVPYIKNLKPSAGYISMWEGIDEIRKKEEKELKKLLKKNKTK